MKSLYLYGIVSSSVAILLTGIAFAQAPPTPPTPPAGEATAAAGDPKQPAFETPPVFVASEVIDAELLSGPHHRVRASARSDGYLIHFTIDSDFGTYSCVGIRELKKRVGEIQAIATLVQVSKGDLFAEGLKQSVEAPIDAVKNIIQDPGESIRRAPQTVGHFFRKLGSSIESAAKGTEERFRKAGEEGDTGGAIADSGKGLGQALKNVAGFDKARLNCARQLGVDPYSDNERLQAEIEKITWAFFAGGLPLRVGAAAASGGASVALTSVKVIGLPDDIYDATPSELALQDKQMLEAMGLASDKIDAVFLNGALTVSLRHSIIQNLSVLPDGTGRAAVIATLIEGSNHQRLAFLSGVLRLLADRHRTAPYSTLSAVGQLPVGVGADGSLEVLTPIDHLSWTEGIAAIAASAAVADVAGPKRLLVFGGAVSESASAQLSAAGWVVVP